MFYLAVASARANPPPNSNITPQGSLFSTKIQAVQVCSDLARICAGSTLHWVDMGLNVNKVHVVLARICCI